MKRQTEILIGSDEPVIMDAVRILLTMAAHEGREFQLTTSAHCNEFIEQARSGRFDLAIMHANCLVPTRPFTLLEHSVFAIKKIKTFGSLTLVVLTTMDEWVEPLRAAGADLCVKMPFDADELRDAISALISLGRLTFRGEP